MTIDPISLVKKRIAARDASHLSPEERAELVLTFIYAALGLDNTRDLIHQPLYSDLMYFALNMLNMHSISIQDEDLIDMMKAVNSHMYATHYSLPEDSPALGPSRDEHKEIWEERIKEYF